MKVPKTLQEAIQHFTDFDNCREFMIAVRWLDGKVRCPACGSEKIIYLANARVYKCNEKASQARSSRSRWEPCLRIPRLPLRSGFPQSGCSATDKNGVSSYEISPRSWRHSEKRMVHAASHSACDAERIVYETWRRRQQVEVDETFIGGKPENLHKRSQTSIESGS